MKSDKVTLVLEATKDGKIRAGAMAWPDPVVVLPWQVLKIEHRKGQVHVLREARVAPPEAPDAGEDERMKAVRVKEKKTQKPKSKD